MTDTVPPSTPYEKAVAEIWCEVLGCTEVGVTDDFFDLDGTSLQALAVVTRIREAWGTDLRARDFFESPTVLSLAAAVAAKALVLRPSITAGQPDAEPMLSFDQQRLWLEHQLRPHAAYNIHGRHRLTGPLNVAVLSTCIRTIVARHESLRTRFPTVNGSPVSVVDAPDPHWRIDVADLTDTDGDRAEATRRLTDAQAVAPFDLAHGPLLRCLLVKLDETQHVLAVTAHHIICDDRSIGLFVQELAALYEAGGDPKRAALPVLPIQYRDYAAWQRNWLTGEALEAQVDYWRGHLADAPEALRLPANGQRSSPQGGQSGRVRSDLPAEDTAALADLCRTYGVTAFMAVLSGLATVLSRWSGQPDVVIGVPITGRIAAGTEELIGLFVNTLPLRVDLSGDPTFGDLLGRVRRAALGGYAHADTPLDLLVKELGVTRAPDQTPLFQVILTTMDSIEGELLSGVTAEPLETPVPPAKVDLSLSLTESRGALHLTLDYDAGRYRPILPELLLEQLVVLLRGAAENPARGIHSYAL
jgi:hypothetical protein